VTVFHEGVEIAMNPESLDAIVGGVATLIGALLSSLCKCPEFRTTAE